jgi:RNA polymerase sigma-70 factor (ECF subfamily)
MAEGHTDTSSEMSDEVLAERVRATGDTAAFAILVARYRGRIVALARRMLGSATVEDAEDVAQDAFVAAYDKRATFRKGEAFRPWLYRIAVNRCLDRLRSRSRKPPPVSIDSGPEAADTSHDPLGNVLAIERDTRLQAAVDALPPKYRAVFLLRHVDDLSYEEIAVAADLPVGTVKTHLFRARAQLRQALEGYLDI